MTEIAKEKNKLSIPPPLLEALIESDPDAATQILESYAQKIGKLYY